MNYIYNVYSGAEIKECEFVRQGIEFCVIDMLQFHIGLGKLEQVINISFENKHLPTGYIPFAGECEGDYFYWNSNTGEIYFISFQNMEHPVLICNSMEEFFDILNA